MDGLKKRCNVLGFSPYSSLSLPRDSIVKVGKFFGFFLEALDLVFFIEVFHGVNFLGSPRLGNS